MNTIFVINPGSTSTKYALFCEGQLFFTRSVADEDKHDNVATFSTIVTEVKEFLHSKGTALDAVAIRILAPGTRFQSHQVIDHVFLTLLKDRELTAPLHIPKALQAVKAAKEAFVGVPLYAVSDSAFHATLPVVAREYSLPQEETNRLDIHRFGYHGLSVSSVVHRAHALLGENAERLIVCHVGGGVSVTAVKSGVSIETTGGFGPVSGLPMGSRAGDVDAGALLEVMEKSNFRPKEASLYLQHSGGLTGLAGDGDIRMLLDKKAHGDSAAQFALEHFSYHFQKAIGSAAVALGGVDALIFTGTAAVRSAELRLLLTSRLDHLGIALDEDKNDVVVGKAGTLHQSRRAVKVGVMPSEEMWEMAKAVESLIT